MLLMAATINYIDRQVIGILKPTLTQEFGWSDERIYAGIVFSFVDDQLFRRTIGYDSERTEGLTNADMVTALSATYGPPSPKTATPAPRSASESLDSVTTVATWRQGTSTVELRHSAYRGSFVLVITSVPLEALARKARTTAEALDAGEAPAREAARAKAEADAARDEAAKTRSTNKATFTP